MYNSNNLEQFFERIHAEASQAAQKVYDKHNKELLERVKNQMGNGHKIFSGMGVCCVSGTNNDDHINLSNNFFSVLADNTQYWNKVEAGFNLPGTIFK